MEFTDEIQCQKTMAMFKKVNHKIMKLSTKLYLPECWPVSHPGEQCSGRDNALKRSKLGKEC